MRDVPAPGGVTIPPTSLRSATPLYTREAFVGDGFPVPLASIRIPFRSARRVVAPYANVPGFSVGRLALKPPKACRFARRPLSAGHMGPVLRRNEEMAGWKDKKCGAGGECTVSRLANRQNLLYHEFV